jgi:arsenite-transporting ATPase
MVLSEEVCINDFFKKRRQMQMKYLKEIKEKFNLPMLQFPLMKEEIKGVNQLKRIASAFPAACCGVSERI